MDVSYEAQLTWERTPRGKIICPECGLDGWAMYLGNNPRHWTRKHAEHVTCSCGRRVSKRGLGAHRGSMARHGKPCP